MLNFVMIVFLYAAISLGLFFKADIFSDSIKYKSKAFEAPIWWVLVLVMNLLTAEKESSRRALLIMLKHPYQSLLLSFLMLSVSKERASKNNKTKPVNRTRTIYHDTNNLVSKRVVVA